MKLFLIVAVFAFVSVVSAEQCEGKNQDVAGGRCFTVYEEKKGGGVTQEQAKEKCGNLDAELATFSSGAVYNKVKMLLIRAYPWQMILTGLTYKINSDPKHVHGKNGPIADIHDWYEGHPIDKKKHNTIIYIPNKNDKFAGLMNAPHDARFTLYICEKQM